MPESPDRVGPSIPPAPHDPSPFGERWADARRLADTPSFRSRREAGVALAQVLSAYAGRPDVLVLAMSTNSVHVAHEVARALSAPLDLFMAGAVSAPAHDQLAVGAVTSGGTIVLNRELVTRLRIPFSLVRDAVARARAEVERRERSVRGDRPPVDATGRTVLLVSDCVGTGTTMRGAVASLRRAGAARIICALPVAPPEVCSLLRRSADDVVVLHTPKPYYGAGAWYEDWRDPTVESTRALLDETPQGVGGRG